MRKLPLALPILAAAAGVTPAAHGATFGEDLSFLRPYTDVIVLSSHDGKAKVAVAPAWQGRVLTSTANGDASQSFGWINRELIAARTLQPHINVFGGEDRLWLGPEGGQFSIFFAHDAKFELANWFTPPPIDTLPWTVVKQSSSAATFEAQFGLTNYSGTRFSVKIDRTVNVLSPREITSALGVNPGGELNVVAYQSVNRLTNEGDQPWEKSTGLLSIWILGMYNPSENATIIVPIKSGSEAERGPKLTSDYFGEVPADRLKIKDDVVFFRADGKYRSKIGLNPKRSKAILGSYDAANHILTLVRFTQPAGATDYVNSLWKLQDRPYAGDAANSYNDGPASPGAKPLGPFYELESSSPGAALAPKKSLTHTHRTFHLTGPETALDKVAQATLGISLQQIKDGLK